MIEDITGLNPIAMGATPNPNAPVATTEMALTSMTSTLRPLLSGYLRVKQNTAQNICRWVQLLVRYDKEARESYTKVFGSFDVQVLVEAEGYGVDYGVKLEARPTATEKKELYESAKISLMGGREGKAGIDESDFFAIVRIIEGGGSLLFAETILSNRIRKARKEFQQSQEKMQEMNAKIQEQAAAQRKDEVLSEKQMEHKNKMEQMSAQHTFTMEELRLQESLRLTKDIGVAKLKANSNESMAKEKKEMATETTT